MHSISRPFQGKKVDLKTLKQHLLACPGATEGAAFGPEHLTCKVMVKGLTRKKREGLDLQ
jgi:hypothetical protein